MTIYVEKDKDTRSSGLIIGAIVLVLVVVVLAVFGLLRVTQTREAELPAVKVQGGQVPAYDVKTAKVDVDSKPVAVDVPKVSMTSTKVAVPVVHVEKAK
jgi:hypothetical protein